MAILIFLIVIFFIVINIPISVILGILCFLPTIIAKHFPANSQYIIRAMVSGVNKTPILAVPLFMLSGTLMAKGGISEKLFNIFAYFVGNKRGGIPIAVIITCLFYGAISGSGPATTAAVGTMTIPILISLGYDKTFSAAMVATAGGLGVIIPPSNPFIMYGLATGESVGALFIAGVLPGILIAFCLIIYAYLYCRINGEDTEKIKANYLILKKKGFKALFKDGFWAILTPVIVLGGIYSGVATPTEIATISVFYALLICLFIYKTISFKDLPIILTTTVRMYAPLSMLLAMALAFGRVITLLNVPIILSDFIIENFASKFTFLLVLNFVLLILGMVLDVGPANIILAPMLLPVATTFGIDPIHLGVIMVCNLAIGFVTPPFGMNLFVAAPLVNIPAIKVGVKAFPFIVAFILALILITFIPQISLILL